MEDPTASLKWRKLDHLENNEQSRANYKQLYVNSITIHKIKGHFEFRAKIGNECNVLISTDRWRSQLDERCETWVTASKMFVLFGEDDNLHVSIESRYLIVGSFVFLSTIYTGRAAVFMRLKYNGCSILLSPPSTTAGHEIF